MKWCRKGHWGRIPTSSMSGSLKPPGPANFDRPTVLSCKAKGTACSLYAIYFTADKSGNMMDKHNACLESMH